MFQNKVFLALGSNIGNWKKNFNYSLIELSKISNIIAIGNIYVTKPYGFKKQDDFYNTALEIETKDTPFQLINKIKLIEKKLHKNKIFKNGPRRIDIDIIFFNSLKIYYKNLIIPHPRAHLRDFVLRPIADIDSNFIHPTKKISIRNLISQQDENFTFRKLSNRNLR